MDEYLRDEYRTDKASYRTEDFLLWESRGMLVLTPKFQRRSVWKPAAKSFLIDTMLRGMIVPPIYLRVAQNEGANTTIREVVDGQQRIRTVLEFIAEKFRLGKVVDPKWSGKSFSQLTLDEQRCIKGFLFPTETFGGISDKQVLEVFCRLNTNGIRLNKQELRNSQYFGFFKQQAYGLSHDYLAFWTKHKMFTDLGIARMLEVELVSELIIAGIDGMQDKKKSIDHYYKNFEEAYPQQSKQSDRFHSTMQTISSIFGVDGLQDSEFRRLPLFYSLYCVVFHLLHGLPGVPQLSAKKKMTAEDKTVLRGAVDKLSGIVADAKETVGAAPKKYSKFIGACTGQTDNISPRKIRFNSLFDEIF